MYSKLRGACLESVDGGVVAMPDQKIENPQGGHI